MDYKRNSANARAFLLGSQLRVPLTLAGNRWLGKARGLVSKDSGATAASGRLIQKTKAGAKGDRIGVQVRFGGAAVPLQFGNKRTRATRFLTRAGE